jgi:hypothetical protein
MSSASANGNGIADFRLLIDDLNSSISNLKSAIRKEELAMRRRLLGGIAWVVLLGALPPATAVEATSRADMELLRSHGIATDGTGLLTFFKQRTADISDEARIKALVRQLGDDQFKVREKASKQLVMIGPRARPFLQTGAKDADPEIARRAQECLARIGEGATAATVSAAVRVLAREKPPEAAAALLAYLPASEDESVAETIRQALTDLARRDDKPEPALVTALADKTAVKRAAAAEALCRAGVTEALPGVRKLLQDGDPQVRLRVGLALVAARDKDAVPVLIRLLDELPLEETGLVMSLLDRLAGDTIPAVVTGPSQAARRKYREAWQQWWKEHEAKIEPARLELASRTLGFTLVVLLDQNAVEDLDRTNRVRWKIEGVDRPLDAQLLAGEERVLVAEYQANRVSERNLKGEIVWKKMIQGPLAAQRLPGGNTFIVTENQLVEVDKDGKEVLTYSRPDGAGFMRAAKLRNGDIAAIIMLGVPRFVRLTPAGKDFKEVKSWGVQVRTSGGRIDVLPNGHVLIPEMENNRVVEYDAEGQAVWEVSIDQPIAAVRLANGNTLITLMRQNRAVEVDRAGKEVWQFKADTRVTRAFRR